MIGTGIRKSLLALATATLVPLTLAASAQATTYYATPSPMGGAMCGSGDPCSLPNALLAANMDGDEVLLTMGTYTITAPLQVNNAIRVAPRVTGTFPTITNAGGFGVTASDTATLEDLNITATGIVGSAGALNLNQATGNRLLVTADGASGAVGVILRGGTLADSGVLKKGDFGAAVETGSGGDGTSQLRNVTAANVGATNPDGLLATPYPGPTSNTVEVSNSILIGDNPVGHDIRAFGMGAGNVTVNVDHSNFDTSQPQTGSVITDLGGNQTDPPMLINVALGIFGQVAGSPTIDSGATLSDLGPLDFDRQSRCMGNAPDIGADEFTAGPCAPPAPPVAPTTPVAPVTAATTPPAAAPKRCKKGRKLKRGKCIKRKKRKTR